MPWLLPIRHVHAVKFLCAQDRCKFELGPQQKIAIERQRLSFPAVGLIPMSENRKLQFQNSKIKLDFHLRQLEGLLG